MAVGTAFFADYAPQVAAKGWGVFPATSGKATSIPWKQYQRRQPRSLEISRWARDHADSGVALPFGPVNGHVVGLDIDEDDPVIAAGTHEIIDHVFGHSPVIRVGRWPRTLRLYRAPRIGPQTVGSVQLLARGNYAVMYGRHPTTGEPYRRVGERDLTEIHPRDLPGINRRAIAQLRSELGVAVANVRRQVATSNGTGLRLQEALRGVEIGRRHKAMLCIASAFRGYGRAPEDAVAAVTEAAGRCAPPYSLRKAVDVVRWVYKHLPEGSPCSFHQEGPTILRIAVRRARLNPYPVPGATDLYQIFLAICEDIQRFLDDQPIALPQPALASLLDCSQQAVGKMIAKAIENEFLEPVCADYQIGSRAKTYRFIAPRQNPVVLT